MKYNQPSFNSDVYSFGVLMCDVFISYEKFNGKIGNEINLQSFLKSNKKDKYDIFPSFFAKIISSCLNCYGGDRPSFNKINKMFSETDQRIDDIEIKKLYKTFINTNYTVKLAEKNDSNALNKLGKMYEKGEVFERDYQKALEFYEKAALLHNSEAQNNYGVLLQEKKKGSTKSDLIKGARYLQLSAEQGNIHGITNYAMALLNGTGVEKNFQKAEEYLKKSADLGYSDAQLSYGCLILDNNPTVSTINIGLIYINKAMRQNNPDAFYIYATMLNEGNHVEENHERALEYFKIAGELGNNEAFLELAKANMNGNLENEKIALRYYEVAFENGDQSVKRKIEKLKEKIYSVNISSQSPTQSKNAPKNKHSEESPNVKKQHKKREYSKEKTIKIKNKSKSSDDSFSEDESEKKIQQKKAKTSPVKTKQSNKIESTIPDKKNIRKYKYIKYQLSHNLPAQVTSKITLISLGKIVYDRPYYHSDNCIYPVGYIVNKEFASIANPNQTTTYRCSILDGGIKPIFFVECLDGTNKTFNGSNPSSPWRQIKVEIDAARKKISGVENYDKKPISGQVQYGLATKSIIYLIERLPNANRVNDYIFKTITQNKHYSDEIEVKEEEDNFDQPPKNRKKQKKSDDDDFDDDNYDDEDYYD